MRLGENRRLAPARTFPLAVDWEPGGTGSRAKGLAHSFLLA